MTEEICNVVYRGISRYIDTASEKVLFCFFYRMFFTTVHCALRAPRIL
jgi:hypothetical protein